MSGRGRYRRRNRWSAPASSSLFADLLGSYPVRMMLAVVMSLGLVILCLRLPVHKTPERIGWYLAPSEPIAVSIEAPEEEDLPEAQQASGVPPITGFEATTEDTQQDGQAETSAQEEARLPQPALSERLQGWQAVVEDPEMQPYIAGGPGIFYMKITYPEEARRKGIQGRLVLDFIVEPDGQTSHIRVLKSLHPLCDSSAVAALRRTRFVPGRQNGETVRVRMRLPVRFQLIHLPAETADAEPAGTGS